MSSESIQIWLFVIAVFQIVMIFMAIPLVRFLLANQKTAVNLENRISSLEEGKVTTKERVEQSTMLMKIETLLEQGGKRMDNIEQNLRLLLGKELDKHGDH